MRGVKTDEGYKDSGFEASKTTTVTRMATPRGFILGRGWGDTMGAHALRPTPHPPPTPCWEVLVGVEFVVFPERGLLVVVKLFLVRQTIFCGKRLF